MEEEVLEQPKSILVDGDTLGDWGNDTRIVEPGEVEEEAEEEPVVEEVLEPEAIEIIPEPVRVPDPGAYEPKDYSFDVTVFDAEGKNGHVVKVTSPEQYDSLLEADTNFGSAAALMKAQRNSSKMETNAERDKSDYDARKKNFEDAKAEADAANAGAQTLVNEVKYLEERGDIPKIAPAYVNANWDDPEVKKQPGIAEQMAIMDVMVKESRIRTKAGLAPVTSFLEGYRIWKDDQRTTRQTTTKQVAGEARRAAGARVAGSTPSPVSAVPKGISVGRAGSLRDLNRNQDWSVN